MAEPLLVVGASVAGIGAVNELRRCGYSGRIIVIDSQNHAPYDRPPLSKAALIDPATANGFAFHDAAHYQELGVELRLSSHACHLNVGTRTIELETGERFQGNAIIIATGARARNFPIERASGKVWTIRDLDDSIGLKRVLTPGAKLSVIGGGFIGAEVASSAKKLGVDVSIFEIADVPFKRILGAEVAARLLKLHLDAGISVNCGVGVECIRKLDEMQQAVELSDGRIVTTDVVVAGLGSVPNLEWLTGSALKIHNGVVCDEFGQTNVPGIYAAGDVASWYNPRTNKHERHEHWTSAREQARIVAQVITQRQTLFWADCIPYFWSDLHGKRIQVLGNPEIADEVRFSYVNDERGSFVAEYGLNGTVIGVAGCNASAKTMAYLARLPLSPSFAKTQEL